MKKIIIACLIVLQACTSSDNYVAERFARTTPEGVSTAVAHRGCWLREPDGEYFIPENSTYGIEMAARYGYPAVEMDVKYTLDQKMVVMHDGTINRTMRNASDYSKIEKPVRVADILFDDLRRDYVLESSDPAKRTPIPTFEEMLLACKRTGVVPMLHSKVLESYELAHKILGNRWIAFEENYSALRVARSISDVLVLWDPGRTSAEQTVEGLKAIGGWTGMSTMKFDMQDAGYIKTMQESGCLVQSSIFPTPHECRSLHDGADIELSDFFWHQTVGREPVTSVSEEIELAAGESWRSPLLAADDFSALTIRLNFTGKLELRVKDHIHRDWRPADWKLEDRVYILQHDAPGDEVVGFRYYKTSPSFEIVALEDCPVKIDAKLYNL
ncbi:MAG: hypothetical protein IJ222_02355 [Bacteroidales bacterium]|nr:hypothetical protein [Bacteroidales bacterium]